MRKEIGILSTKLPYCGYVHDLDHEFHRLIQVDLGQSNMEFLKNFVPQSFISF
jgi:hypothetical protein